MSEKETGQVVRLAWTAQGMVAKPEHVEGGFVRFSDYERLQAELAHVRKVRNDSAEDMRREIAGLREELAECYKWKSTAVTNLLALALRVKELEGALRSAGHYAVYGDKYHARETIEAALTLSTATAEEILRQHDAKVIEQFIGGFKRHVGGDGEFWLHELESFRALIAAPKESNNV